MPEVERQPIPRIRRTVNLLGARFAIDSPVVAAIHAARFLARYPRCAAPERNLRLTVEVTETRPSIGEWPAVSMVERVDGIDVATGGSRLQTWTALGRATLELDEATIANDDACRLLVEAAFWSLTIGGGHLHAVHSALVGRGSSGILLRGESGAGKSTLSYACLRRGMWLSSDDFVYGLAAAPPDRLWGYPWRAWMTTDAAARFGELATIEPLPHPAVERVKVPIIPPVGHRRISLSIDAIVFIDPHRVLGARRIDAAEARRRFDDSALDSERRSLPSAWLDGLFDRPCYVVERGDSPDAAAELLDRLTTDVGHRAGRASRT